MEDSAESIVAKYMCSSCKPDHTATTTTFTDGACSAENMPVFCDYNGIATPSPTPAPTAVATSNPTPAPTAEPTPKPDPVGGE